MSSASPAASGGSVSPVRAEMDAWLRRQRAFDEALSLDERRAVAADLSLAIAAAPEVHPAQCALLLRAWPLRPGASLPDFLACPLPARSLLAWARLALLVEPARWIEALAARLPWPVLLDGLDLTQAPDVLATLRALLQTDADAPRACALGALAPAINGGALSIAQAHALLLDLLSDTSRRVETRRRDMCPGQPPGEAPPPWGSDGTNPGVASPGALRRQGLPSPTPGPHVPATGFNPAQAFSALAAPWACGLPVPEGKLARGVRSGDEAEALAAAEAAGLRGSPLALELLSGETLARRLAGVGWAGKIGGSDAVHSLLEAALREPADLGPAAFRALVELHHRGHFIQPAQASTALAALSAGAGGDAAESLPGLLFVARHAVVEKLLALDDDDPDWLHLLPVLAAWCRAPRPPAGLVDLLLRVAARSRRPAAVALAMRELLALFLDLPSLPPGPLERLALDRLDAYPDESLALLEVTAGTEARSELLRRTGWGTDRPCEEPLVARWRQVHAALWRASSWEEHAELLRSTHPMSLRPATIRVFPETTDMLRRRLGTDDINQAFVAFSEVASPENLDELTQGLQRVLEAAVHRRWQRVDGVKERGWTDREDRPVRFPTGEDLLQIPPSCADAVDAMEARWRGGHVGPAWLLAPGKRLLASMLLRIHDETDDDALRAGALRSLLEREHPLLAARAAEALRSTDTDVAKLGARLLARSGARWLSIELARGAEDTDERRARSCLDALAEVSSPLAEAAALRCLEHRNMNLKKSAADALARVATPASLPALLRWLGQHDNPGLRASLVAALRRTLGGAYRAGLLAAIHGAAGDERRARLLIEALSGEIDPPLVRALARQSCPWLRWLLEGLCSNEIHLARGSLRDLAPELRAAGLPAPPPERAATPGKERFSEALDALLHGGFSVPGAEAALACWPATLAPEHTDRLRRDLGAWIRWMLERRDVRPAPLLCAILAAPSAPEAALIDRNKRALLGLLDDLPTSQRAHLWPLVEALCEHLDPLDRLDLGLRLRSLLGQLPGLRTSPLGLLRRCGLVLTRDDVERALDGVTDVPDPAAVQRDILRDAFGLPGQPLPRGPWRPFQHKEAPAEDWAGLLDEALRATTPAFIERLRAVWLPGEDETLRALIDELPSATPEARGACLDWMEALRPVGVDAWPRPVAPPSPPHHSRARARDHEARLAWLASWLRGDVAVRRPEGIDLSLPELEALLPESKSQRLIQLLPDLAPVLHDVLREKLHARWEELSRQEREELERLRPYPREPDPTEGWVSREFHEQDRAALRALWDTPVAPEASEGAGRERWLAEARGADIEAARHALTKLAARPDETLRALLLDLAARGPNRLRLHALRLIRKVLSREDALAASRLFLDNEDASTRRMAIRAVCHGRDEASLPRVVELLLDPVAWVREAALEGLVVVGEPARHWLQRACDHARPDEARHFRSALDRL